MKAMIFDMDGTLADVREITHALTGDISQNNDHYHELSIDVPAVEEIVRAAQSAHDLGYAVLIVTARKTKYMEVTGRFIVKHDIPCDAIFMRGDDDNRPDYELKKAILTKIYYMGYEVERAYDDNPEIIRLWEEAGIETVHVTGYGFKYDDI